MKAVQKILQEIPPSRLLLYALFLSFLPLFLLFAHFFSEKKSLTLLHQRIEYMREQALGKEQRDGWNWAVYHNGKNADHFYVDKHLESLSLLARERRDLDDIVQDKNFANDSRINGRLQYLSGKENRLTFIEGVVHTHPLFQETTEVLGHPVEVDLEDIQTLLSRIERRPIGGHEPPGEAPQLLIADWKMNRKMVYDNHEVFTLHCTLIKREFL